MHWLDELSLCMCMVGNEPEFVTAWAMMDVINALYVSTRQDSRRHTGGQLDGQHANCFVISGCHLLVTKQFMC
jgi:hypothetical protein